MLGIPLLAVGVLALIAHGLRRSRATAGERRRFVLGAVCWLGVSASLALSGFLAREDLAPLPMLCMLVPILTLPVAFGLSSAGTALVETLPLSWLVGFHAFRLPLELVMHQAADEGAMPSQMTFTGLNFDIITGVCACALGLWLTRAQVPTWLLLAFNLLGSLLLATIVAVAVSSLPLFHAFGSAPERLNTWVFYFPFVWLPAILVASALLGHVLLWRRLWRELGRQRDAPAFAP
jgi:hypothetical protein